VDAGRPISQEPIKDMMRNSIDQLEFSPEIPVLLNLKTGWSGRSVVRRGQKPTEAGAIDVLTLRDSTWARSPPGRLPFPPRSAPEGLVAFIERDELDVPTSW